MSFLEIYPYLPDITRTILDNNVTFVSAPTGYGKTVGMPLALSSLGVRTMVSIPTKASVIGLVENMKNIQKSRGVINVNDFVGSSYDSQVNYSDNSKIIFATARHVRNKLVSDYKKGKIDFCDVLFVDEVHNQTLDISVILTVWKEAYKNGMEVPRLLISSATPINIFDDLNIAYFTVEGERKYPSYIKYLMNEVLITSPVFNEIIIELIKEIHETTSLTENPHILVFLTGLGEIDPMLKNIPDYDDCVKLRMYGNMSIEERKMIDYEFPGKRKIILSTNAAEASITVVELGYVIDSLLEYRTIMTSSGGTRLSIQRISKDSAIQRAGRTGRKNEGIIFRMITEKEFDSLQQHIPREIDTLPIYEPILELVSANIDPFKFPIDKNKIKTSLDLLISLDIIQNGIVTEIGDFSVTYPIPLRLSTFLYHWIRLELPLYQGCVIVSLITNYGPSFFLPLRRDPDLTRKEQLKLDEKHKEFYFEKYQGENVYDTLINMWVDLYENTENLTEGVKSYCSENSLNFKKISDSIKLFQQCFRKKHPEITNVDPNLIDRTISNNFLKNKKIARTLLYATHKSEVLKHLRQKNYINKLGEIYVLEENELIEKRQNYDEHIVGLIMSEIGMKDGNIKKTVALSFPIEF